MSALTVALFVLLSAVSVGALAYALLLPRINLERNAAQRRSQMSGGQDDAVARRRSRDKAQELAKRRRTLQTALKAVDDKQRQHDRLAIRPTLEKRIARAGLSLSPRGFVLWSVATGAAATLLSIVLGFTVVYAVFIGGLTAFALPRWLLARMLKRRQDRFIEEFSNAIDVIVRGIKSGLPLNDTLRMVASEAREPVGAEFRRVVEAQQLGMSTAEAIERLYQNMPLAETNFFSIVIAIQAQAGGNLSEALGNLSRVLRERRRMKGKIQTMSQEAKASGAIIAALPPIVAIVVHLTTPDYLEPLFSTTLGNLLLLGCAIWMSLGVLIMHKMIAFEF